MDPRQRELFFELYGNLPRAGPGDEASTLRALELLPEGGEGTRRVLDLGSGPCSQTRILEARLPGASLLALDLMPEFLGRFRAARREGRLSGRTRMILGDMTRLPIAEGSMDLLWAEGSLYAIGVEEALGRLGRYLRKDGFLAFSDAVWLVSDPPAEILGWWQGEYPAMRDLATAEQRCEALGWRRIGSFVLPAEAWTQGYYEPLEERLREAQRLLARVEWARAVLEPAARELEMFRTYGRTYGYAFFVLRKMA